MKKRVVKELVKKVVTMFNSKKFNGLHFTTNHNGKMSGMYSISTSCICNEYCKKYACDPEKVCSKCYANTQLKMWRNMQAPLEENTRILTTSIIDPELLPIINALYFRFEAFGDLNNNIQVINYFNICDKNPHVNFALWTKNPHLIDQAIKAGYKKPENLNIIVSSHYLNVVSNMLDRYSFIDKIFTVYTPDYIAENNISINCGAKNCLQCGLCYQKNDVVYINEKLK